MRLVSTVTGANVKSSDNARRLELVANIVELTKADDLDAYDTEEYILDFMEYQFNVIFDNEE